MMTGDSIDLQALLLEYSNAWNDHDCDRIANLHTLDTEFRTHIGTEAVIGREAMRAACAELFATYKGFHGEHSRVLFGANHWVVEWTFSASMASGPGDAQDHPFSIESLDIVVVTSEGLVARKDTYMDFAQLAAAMSG